MRGDKTMLSRRGIVSTAASAAALGASYDIKDVREAATNAA